MIASAARFGETAALSSVPRSRRVCVACLDSVAAALARGSWSPWRCSWPAAARARSRPDAASRRRRAGAASSAAGAGRARPADDRRPAGSVAGGSRAAGRRSGDRADESAAGRPRRSRRSSRCRAARHAKESRSSRSFVFTRVLNGFSAALDARALAVARARPRTSRASIRVRAAYPASVVDASSRRRTSRAGTGPARSSVVGLDGNGVVVALLDTGVDRLAPVHPCPGCSDGLDILDPEARRSPARTPDAPAARASRHRDGRPRRRLRAARRDLGRRARRVGPADPGRRLAAER